MTLALLRERDLCPFEALRFFYRGNRMHRYYVCHARSGGFHACPFPARMCRPKRAIDYWGDALP